MGWKNVGQLGVDGASTDYVLGFIRFFYGHPVEVLTDAFGGFTYGTVLHLLTVRATTDMSLLRLSDWADIFQELKGVANADRSPDGYGQAVCW